ncbi:MAG: D-aminoacylase [Sphaerochaeta sp.]
MIRFSNALIVDGSGATPYRGDVLVEGERIAAILPPSATPAPDALDCSSLILTPGFIDMHGHSELEVLRSPSMRPKIGQGITTEVAGNCGIGVFPAQKGSPSLKALTNDVLGSYPDVGWDDFSSYLKAWQSRGSGTNMAFLQAHSTLRSFALEGNPNRSATSAEVETMCLLLQKSLEQGCLGMSSGLYYAPCLFADRKELLALLEVVRQYDRLFSVHVRCEGNEILSSLGEVVDLARLSGVRLQISHLKVIGRENQQLVTEMLHLIEDARSEGLDVQFDQYPYEYGSTSLFSLLPPPYLRLERKDLQSHLKSACERDSIRRMMEEGDGWDSLAQLCGWDAIRILSLDSNPRYIGMTLTEVASERGQGPYDAFFDLLAEEEGAALMTDITQSQDTIRKILSHSLMCFGTDALYAGSLSHPRSYQAAIHLLDRYCKQQEVLPLELMIAKMTSVGAHRLGLADRGLIQKGFKADLVLLDWQKLSDNSTQANPDAKSTGLELVMVNGNIAFQHGQYTDATAGSALLY